MFRSLNGVSDIDIPFWSALYTLCCEIISRPHDFSDACRNSVMASLFFEPSTRTKFSFQAAMLRLGGSVFGFDNADFTSASKGESLADTIRMTASYSDVIVMRSPREGAARAASLYSETPIINAGDGGHEHPTQTLTDLTAISRYRSEIRDFTIGICGDLKNGRTVHSLVHALTMFPGIEFVFISPDELSMPDYITRALRSKGYDYRTSPSIESALPELDILYMTRAQRERMSRTVEYTDDFILTADKLKTAKKDLAILHPLPRVSEISPEVDLDPRAKYFEQAKFGMYIRMALLMKMCALPKQTPPPVPVGGASCNNPMCITKSELYLPPLQTADGSCAYCM